METEEKKKHIQLADVFEMSDVKGLQGLTKAVKDENAVVIKQENIVQSKDE